jgi:glycosyltransferase involved in cell wall biosynthesis
MTSAEHTIRPEALRLNEPRLEGAGVWMVVPCYKVKAHILQVIAKAPAWVEGIVCVDDACPEKSGDFIESNAADPRVVVVRLAENQGVGGATMAGYAEADRRGGRILVKVDGDDQMDLGYMAQLVAPLLLGEADYAKGNRFTSISHLRAMPGVRVFGNAALSFAAKVSTGYWNMFDPTNGFTAIEACVARRAMQKRVARRFFFETDLLYHLGTLRAVVRDVPIPARYGDEVSNLRIARIVAPFAGKHLRNAARRFVGQYFVRDFTVASLESVLGILLVAFGGLYGLVWIATPHEGTAPAGVVMAAALPIIVGVQLLLQAINYDVLSSPTEPIHTRLLALDDLEAQA